MGDIAPKLSLQRSMIYGAIRIPVYYCRTHQGLMAKAKKTCQHIHGSAFVVNDQILLNRQYNRNVTGGQRNENAQKTVQCALKYVQMGIL